MAGLASTIDLADQAVSFNETDRCLYACTAACETNSSVNERVPGAHRGEIAR
jgi:hypothetical protein